MEEQVVIKVEKVYKDFILPHQRAGTVKGAFTSMFSHATKTKEKQHALTDISFEVKKGEFFGIVGRNGSGKSTLLKILAGIYQPNKGKINTIGKVVPFIELGVGFNPELSGRDNVYLNGAILGFSVKEIDKMYDSIVKFAELERFMDQKLKNYSSGMQVRLAFSLAIKAQGDILLIDEVLAVGDADFQRKCFEYFKTLKKNKKTVIFVTHEMGAIREFCDRAILIEENKLMREGKATDIADEYSKMFLDDNDKSSNEQLSEVTKQNRWGNKKIVFYKVITKISEEFVIIETHAKINENLDGVMYGLHISGQDGAELTAMNNRMVRRPDLKDLRKGEKAVITWKLVNIFNDGKYFITLTLVDESGIAFDWFVDASSFRVKKSERSTTAILPPIEVDYSVG